MKNIFFTLLTFVSFSSFAEFKILYNSSKENPIRIESVARGRDTVVIAHADLPHTEDIQSFSWSHESSLLSCNVGRNYEKYSRN